ncbi:MAG: hypothetical protein ACRD07_22330 [Acidimicrobiales bacterium]
MFVQVIEGKVGDLDTLRSQIDKWLKQLGPGATGWLGHTAGVAADGTFFAAVRFRSAEAAKANSNRPEQGAWWEETSRCLVGDVRFADCRHVDRIGTRHGSDDAGFVQVIQGRGDRQAMLAASKGRHGFFARMRPDVLGAYVGWEGAGRFSQLVYFESEAAAREGEQRYEIVMAAVQFDRFIDLTEPWLASA